MVVASLRLEVSKCPQICNFCGVYFAERKNVCCKRRVKIVGFVLEALLDSKVLIIDCNVKVSL